MDNFRRGADSLQRWSLGRDYIELCTDLENDDVFVHNTDEDEPVKWAVLMRKKVQECGEPDAFFAEVCCGTDVAVFFSTDESIVGRCVTVQVNPHSFAVTLVHSELNASTDLNHFVAVLQDDMTHHVTHVKAVRKMMHHFRGTFLETMEAALKDSTELIAHHLRSGLESVLWEVDDRRLVERPEAGPDLPALLAEAPGPIVDIKHVACNARCAVTCMAGTVALLYGDDYVDIDRRLPVGVRAAICVHRVKQTSLRPPDVTYHICDDERHVQVHVGCVPIAHVAHIIQELAALIIPLLARRPQSSLRRLHHRISESCNPKLEDDVLDRRYLRQEAVGTIARCVNANMARIKAHLWRPDGRLVQRMIAEACSE